MAFTTVPTRTTADPVINTDWNTYVSANFTEVEARKESDYIEVTTASTVISATTAATANTIITGTAFTPSGADKYRVEFGCESAQATAISTIVFHLYDGATNLGRLGVITNPAAAAFEQPVFLAREYTPSNASHTFSIRAHRVTANWTIIGGAGGADVSFPIFIRTTRLP